MKCPFCSYEDTQVKDSRSASEGGAIRRRRFCPECKSRFTTFERVHLRNLMVLKTSGKKQPFNREKLTNSIYIATRKRPVSDEQIENMINSIVSDLEKSGDIEIPSSLIGKKLMEELKKLDKIAYIRFASVYRNFQEVKEFEDLVGELSGV